MRGIHSIFAILLISSGLAPSASGQTVTNWVAYNDHRPSVTPVAMGWAATAPRATGYDMGAPADVSGTLTNFFNGQALPVTVTFARTGAPDNFGAITRPVPTNTPMGRLFYGICDLSNDGIVGVSQTDGRFVTTTFSGLDPAKRYAFRGSTTRGGGYLNRWTVAAIQAADWIDAHINGLGGVEASVLTSNTYPAALTAGEAAFRSGHNHEGAVIAWDFISPFTDGTFSITCKQYTNTIPIGSGVADGPYGYSFGAIQLAEVEVSPPMITTNPPALTTVLQNRPFSLSVSASGTPLLYQWHKQGVGAIAGATFRTYSVPQAALGDSGDYFVVVYNPLGNSVTSTVARVTVNADLVAPSIETALSFPAFDFSTQVATLNQVIVEYNEAIQTATAGNPSQYNISGGVGNPVSVTVTNDRAVILGLAAPLTEDTTYTVQVSGILDLAGNNIGNGGTNNPASFRTWARGVCNGLLFEAFTTGAGVTVDILTNSPNFPNNPFFTTNLWAFDTRVAFPDDSNGGYGSRVRGLFIPPISGNWVFFLRAWDRGQFYINPNGLDPAGRQLVLEEGTGNNPRNWDKFATPGIPLKAGRGYYVESLQQAEVGTGIDVIKIAARLAGTGTPQPNDAANTIIDTNAIQGPYIGFPLMPRGIAGTFTVVQQPVSVSTQANERATFTVVVSAPQAPYICYQWERSDDGGASFNPIPGATRASYTTPYLTVADDNNDRYRVQAGIPGESVTSSVATLMVVADVKHPRVTRVVAINATNIVVFFSEPLSATGTAVADPDAYRVDDPNVSLGSALISPTDPLRVDLFLSESGFPLMLGNTYTLQVSTDSTPLADDSGNALDPDPTRIMFRAQEYTGDLEDLRDLPIDGVLPPGSLTDRGFAGRLLQIGVAKPNGTVNTESVLAGTFLDPGNGMPAPNISPLPVFYETNIINYNRDASLEPPGASVGSILADAPFPGYTTSHTNFDNMVMEVAAYLHLQPGIYRFGVSSDDGFRVSPALHVGDANNSITLGEFNGGRGQPNETLFDFYAPQEGLYPFRLIWEQGNGGANVEWWEVNLGAIGTPRVAINAAASAGFGLGLGGPGGGGPPAFTPPCTAKSLAGSLSGGNLIITWPISGGGNLFALQGTASLTPPIAWSFVPQIPQNVAGNKRVVIPPAAPHQFYRLYKAAPPNCP